jgi:LytS/YehU family sensor histidine kinase
MVGRLADLLRHSLDSREHRVPLRVELEALGHYLEIEQVRFGERLSTAIDVPGELGERAVPSFVLQPLVENAIRHGFRDGRQVLHVNVRARAYGARLVLTIADDGAGLGAAGETREGLGLGNTRARLRGLYGEAASLALAPGTDGRGTVVTVVIPPDPREESALA